MSLWFANIRYSRKMLIAFGIIIVAGMVPFVIGLRSLLAMRDALHTTHVEGNELSKLHEAQTDLLRMQLHENAYLVSRAPADLEAGRRLAGQVDRALEEFAAEADSDDEREEARRVQELIRADHQAFLQLGARAADGASDAAAAATRLTRQTKVTEQLRALVDGARSEIDEALTKVGQSADEDTQTTMLVGVFAAIICMVVGVGLGLLLARGITRPITELRTVAEKISLGETDVKVTTGRKDEIGQLADSFDRMVTAVRFLQMEVAAQEESQQERES
jgi:methyl-accepting chemotaxis protein